MFGPAALAFAISTHSIGVNVTIHPDPAPVAAAQPRARASVNSAAAERFLLRMAARMLAGHLPVSPAIIPYKGYSSSPAMEHFAIPLCEAHANGRIELHVCSK